MGEETIAVTTYRDIEPASIRIVVQAGPSAMGRIWHGIYADGFRMRSDGSTRPLPDKEIYEFT